LYKMHQYELMISMIQRATKYIYIEAKYFWSDDRSQNRIAEALANKIKQKHNSNQPFKVVIVTNRRNHKLNYQNQLTTTCSTSQSFNYLFHETNLSKKDFETYCSLNFLNSPNSAIVVENLILCVDGLNLLFSTGFIDDNTLIRSPNMDRNLGIYLNNTTTVRLFEAKLYRSLLRANQSNLEPTIDDVFVSASQAKYDIHKYKFQTDCELIDLFNKEESNLVKLLLRSELIL